jgi:prophage tail gpP-like protein
MPNVTLKINGKSFSGWESIRIERSIETLSGSFSLGVTDRWPGLSQKWEINGGDRCTVLIDNTVVITGFVDEDEPELDADSHDISVNGRDNTCDLVDCSAIHNPSQWIGQSLESIVRDLIAPFGIKLIVKAPTGEAFKKFSLEQGETVFEAISRLCRLRAVLAYSDGLGNLIITTAGTSPSAVALIEGKNIKSSKGTFSVKERFSEVHVKSQTQGSDDNPPSVTSGWKGAAYDKEVTRYRPLLIVAENQANAAQCQERAEWEVATRSGKGNRVVIKVQGWRQGPKTTDPLWQVNSLVFVQSSAAKANGQYLISSVVFTLDEDGGTVTELTLVKPGAFKLIREVEEKKT